MQNDLTGFNFDMNLSSIEPWASYSRDHTDLPRLREGRVGGQVHALIALVKNNKKIFVHTDPIEHRFMF